MRQFAKTTAPLLLGSALLSLLCASVAFAESASLEGRVQDAVTGLPVPNALVRVLQTGQETTTDADGRYRMQVEEGEYTLRVRARSGEDANGIFAHQKASLEKVWPATLNLLGLSWHHQSPALEHAYGLPGHSGRISGEDYAGSLRFRDYLAHRAGVSPEEMNRIHLTLPMQLPETVRVARRFASSCSGNPIQRIDEVPLEEYVQGVLVPEIGVFRSAATGRESSRDVFKAFAVAARSYVMYFVMRYPDREYHLDDTACNQRYDDARDPWVEALVAETASQVMVQAGTTDTFDKFEYAASCGRHSSLPEYQSTYVSDAGLTEVCVGSWCGHNTCAAHEDNPEVPGDDRCLVRGLCQWGGLERSAGGQDYLEILAHYQPNLDVRDMSLQFPEGGDIKGYVRSGESFESGDPVPGAIVALDNGISVIVGDTGYFEFASVDAGQHNMSVSASGFETERRTVDVTDGENTWVSVLLDPDMNEPDMGGDPDMGGGDMGPSDDVEEPDLPEEDTGSDLEDPEDVSDEPDLVHSPDVADGPDMGGGNERPDVGGGDDAPDQGDPAGDYSPFSTSSGGGGGCSQSGSGGGSVWLMLLLGALWAVRRKAQVPSS